MWYIASVNHKSNYIQWETKKEKENQPICIFQRVCVCVCFEALRIHPKPGFVSANLICAIQFSKMTYHRAIYAAFLSAKFSYVQPVSGLSLNRCVQPNQNECLAKKKSTQLNESGKKLFSRVFELWLLKRKNECVHFAHTKQCGLGYFCLSAVAQDFMAKGWNVVKKDSVKWNCSKQSFCLNVIWKSCDSTHDILWREKYTDLKCVHSRQNAHNIFHLFGICSPDY